MSRLPVFVRGGAGDCLIFTEGNERKKAWAQLRAHAFLEILASGVGKIAMVARH
jgi:hypothetical protein